MAILCKQFSIEYRKDCKHRRDPEDDMMYDGYSDIALTFRPFKEHTITDDGLIAYDIFLYEKKVIKHVADYMKNSGYNETCVGEETRFFGKVYFTQKELNEIISTPTYDKFMELVNKTEEE